MNSFIFFPNVFPWGNMKGFILHTFLKVGFTEFSSRTFDKNFLCYEKENILQYSPLFFLHHTVTNVKIDRITPVAAGARSANKTVVLPTSRRLPLFHTACAVLPRAHLYAKLLPTFLITFSYLVPEYFLYISRSSKNQQFFRYHDSSFSPQRTV